MSSLSFSQPQRQSVIGLILIFTTVLYQIGRNFWVLIIYFFVDDFSRRSLLLVGAGSVLLLFLILAYSIIYYLNFKFHIDEKNQEFVLQKGVFSTDIINIPFQKIQQVSFRRNILQRVIGVYSVVVETAGSQEKEVEIKALSQTRANALAEKLMVYAEEEKSAASVSSEEITEVNKEKVKPDWEHKVNLATLVKLGLTRNYLRGLSVIIAFYITLREQFTFNEELSAQLQEPEMYWEQGKFTLLFVLFLVGMFMTVGETVIKYYGLHLQKFKDTLQVEMGLRNNTRVNIKAGRIQLLQVLTNPIQKLLGLYAIKISLASSEDALKKNQIKVLGLPLTVVKEVKAYFYAQSLEEKFRIAPSRFLFWKRISRGLIPLAILLAGWYFYDRFLEISWIMGITGAYLLIMIFYNYKYCHNLKLGVSEDFLIRHSGVWSQKTEILESYKLQAVTITQPLWYKKRGLVNLKFHSAGGDLSFPMIPKEKATALSNLLTYKIESTERAWM